MDDRELSTLGIPLGKLNSKCVAEFVHRQEAIASVNSMKQVVSINSVSNAALPEALEVPLMLT